MSAGWIKQTLFDERSPTWVRLERLLTDKQVIIKALITTIRHIFTQITDQKYYLLQFFDAENKTQITFHNHSVMSS